MEERQLNGDGRKEGNRGRKEGRKEEGRRKEGGRKEIEEIEAMFIVAKGSYHYQSATSG